MFLGVFAVLCYVVGFRNLAWDLTYLAESNIWDRILILEKAYAHSVSPEEHSWTNWNLEDPLFFGLFLYVLFYLKAYHRSSEKGLSAQLVFFVLSVASLIASLFSPIDVMSDALAWVHMLQHTLLMMVAAPLMVLARPIAVFAGWLAPLWSAEGPRSRRIFKTPFFIAKFRNPFVIWFFYLLTLWLWHLPLFYESALANRWVHDFQHFCFFLSSFFFWRVSFEYYKLRHFSELMGVLYLFVSSLHAMILGVFMALAPLPWYDPYVQSAPLHGYTALEDQHIAGLIMWMPAGLSYVWVALLLIKKRLS